MLTLRIRRGDRVVINDDIEIAFEYDKETYEEFGDRPPSSIQLGIQAPVVDGVPKYKIERKHRSQLEGRRG